MCTIYVDLTQNPCWPQAFGFSSRIDPFFPPVDPFFRFFLTQMAHQTYYSTFAHFGVELIHEDSEILLFC